MLPLLEFAKDSETHSMRDAVTAVSDYFSLTEEERKRVLPSGRGTVIGSRVGWARTYLRQAGLLELPQPGFIKITKRGLEALTMKPEKIDTKFLEQYEEFRGFRERSKPKIGKTSKPDTPQSESPLETLETAYETIRADLEAELLNQVNTSSPHFFENLVVDLLVKMGYGGSLQDAGRAVGQSGDGGIDGIIKEDRLGLDIVYVQAKRWENVVGRPEIQKFAGALLGQSARKGVFITTSSFSKEAVAYADQIDSKIVLLDGERLTSLMVDHDVGVTRMSSYDIKKVDADYFTED